MNDAIKFFIVSVLLVACSLLFSEQADAGVRDRDYYATILCEDTFNTNVAKFSDKNIRVLNTINVGEVKPFVWLMNYTFSHGRFIQGYCVITPDQIVFPALDSIREAVELSKR
jgi:hypothetical protein